MPDANGPETVEKAFKEIRRLDQNLTEIRNRAFGFAEENWNGGKFKEIKDGQLELKDDLLLYHQSNLDFQTSLPIIINDVLDKRDQVKIVEKVEGVKSGTRRFFFILGYSIAGGVITALIVTVILLSIGLSHVSSGGVSP